MKENVGHFDGSVALSLENALHHCAKPGHRKSRGAIEFVYKRFHGYLFAIALRYVKHREDAEELVNESFVRAFGKISDFMNKGSQRTGGADVERMFKGWIAKICVNASIDFLRSKRTMQSLDDDEDEAYQKVESLTVEEPGDMEVEDIMKMLFHLPEIQRTIFNLYEVEGYSHEEIADMLRIPAGTSRTYLTRAKERLRQLYTNRNLTARY